MADYTITGRFAEDAELSVYEPGDTPGADTAVATGTVVGGEVTFTGLGVGKSYIVYNDADATDNLHFATDAASSSVTADYEGVMTGDIDFQGQVGFSGVITDVPDDTITKAMIHDDAVGKDQLHVVFEDVTVALGQTTGTADVTAGAVVLSIFPVSNQDQLVDSVLISGTTLTVTLAAAATAANVFKVAVLEP